MGVCDICNEPLKEGEGYLLHGKLVARANYMAEVTRRSAAKFGMSPEEMQANLMAKARVDTTPWMACEKCIPHFLGTQEEKVKAHDLAKRYWQGESIPLDVLPTTSSLFEEVKKAERPKKTMVCRACGKEVDYDEKLTACPHCMTYDPGWVMVMPGTEDPRAQKHKEKAGEYYTQGLKRQAISEFQRAAEIDPSDPTVYNNIGAIYGELGEYDEAIRYLRKALEIDPDLGPAKRQLHRIEEILGRRRARQEEPKEEERRPVIRPEVEEERVYPWRGISKMYRVALVLAALVWLGLVGRAMNVAAQDPIVYLIFAVILLVLPARAIFDALRPTTMRELVISPERGLIFRRKSGREKPVFAKIDRVAETMRGKALLIQGLSPEGKKVRAQIAKGNLEEGEFERFKEDLQTLVPGVKITPVPTRALSWRRVFAGITALLGVLFLGAFLFTAAASVHDYVKGLEFERIPLQTQVVIILALLVAFLLFAGLSTLLSERRKIGILFWSGLFVLGAIGTGYVMAYVWEGGLLRTALPSVPPTATPVSRFVTFEGDIFSFECPSNWEVITEKEIAVLLDTSLKGLSPGGYDYIGGVYTGGVDGCRNCAHIVVVSLRDPNLTGTLTDEQYEQVKASYENTMGPRLISIKRTEVSGMPGVEVVNIGRSKETKLRGVIIVPPEPGMAYSLNCLSHKDSFDDFEAIFSRAIESLRIGKVAPLTTTPSPATEVITYTVQAGDTLAKIAAEFGVTVEVIVEANDIEDPSLINVGQVLVIPKH